jgi:hypothetical protein
MFWRAKRLLGVLVQLLLVGWLVGCNETSGPPLLELTDLSPRSLEVGDLIELKGAGFPEGKAATVTLEGTLYRAGLPSVDGFRITFDARGDSSHQASFTVGEEIEEALGEGEERAAHATFRGRALLAFAPRVAGAPPISGQMSQLSLELFSAKDSTQYTRELEDARRLTDLLGLTVEPIDRAVRVTNVVPGRAQRAGIVAGDVIASCNGVSVFDATDLLPARQEREVQLTVKRSESIEPWPVRLSIDGFSPLLPPAFTWVFAALIAIALWAVVLFSTGRSGGLVSTWSIVQPPSTQSEARPGSQLALATWVGLAAALLAAAPSSGRGMRLVNALLVLSILLLRPLLGFVAHGGRGRGFSLRRATASALKIQVLELCVVVGLLPIVLYAGGLGPVELRAVQGPLPWQWLAFRSLPMALGALLFLLSTLYDASGAAEARLATPQSGVGGSKVLRFDDALVFLKCAVFVSVFLGGGLVGGGSLGGGWVGLNGSQGLTRSVSLVAIFAVKYALVAGLVIRARSRLGYPSRTSVAGSFYGAFALCALVNAVAALPVRWDQIVLLDWLRQGISPALCLAALLGILLMGKRSAVSARGLAINPWL